MLADIDQVKGHIVEIQKVAFVKLEDLQGRFHLRTSHDSACHN